MTIDQVFSQAIAWCKRLITLALLIVIAVTSIELLGIRVPQVPSLDLNQNTGIGLAGLGFLLSKI